MAETLAAPPVLSTPAEQLFEHVESDAVQDTGQVEHATQDELREVYEISRTARELRDAGRRRIALQFPDHMLRDAPAVVALLRQELDGLRPPDHAAQQDDGQAPGPAVAVAGQDVAARTAPAVVERIYILADTSYSACCVDEVAAEHIDADVVVHYGRSCLSPTSRLPVIYVFTKHRLDHAAVASEFERQFPDRDGRVVLMADVAYQDHLPLLYPKLRDRGYTGLLSTAVVRRPTGKLPNRTVIDSDGNEVDCEGASGVDLTQCDVFHISLPPTSFLLALSTRVRSLHVFPTAGPASAHDVSDALSVAQTTRRLLGRRYAKVLTLSTAGVIGILVNTLSVSNYLSSIDAIRRRIAAAGKKSYTVVVGKLNPAKLANFAEIDGWVVVGCWESSLVEDDASFYRPAVTPFELEVALMRDDERVWGSSWWGGIEGVKEPPSEGRPRDKAPTDTDDNVRDQAADAEGSESESEPPEFDLRTGKLVARSRPMRPPRTAEGGAGERPVPRHGQSGALALRPKAELATVNGVVSPGAEFLRSQRTWTGLGSDFASSDERSTAVEEGRSGVARGYTVGSGVSERT